MCTLTSRAVPTGRGTQPRRRQLAYGGVTTIVDMPLNSIPATTTLAALETKREAAANQCRVDVAFWGGAVPGNVGELLPMYASGVAGFKCFMLPSGVDEFPPLDDAELLAACERIASFAGLLIAHCEDAGVIDAAPQRSGREFSDFLASRPAAAESVAIRRLLDVAARTGCRVHIVHLADASSIPMIEQARAAGVNVTVETCPHYLSLDAAEVPDGDTTFKCCPPIRDAANRDGLWQGLLSGAIDLVVSDHSPCTPDLKLLDEGDFAAAWGGIASLQLALPIVWTEARRRGIGLPDVLRWMSVEPARLTGLDLGVGGKGDLRPGSAADFSIFAPDESFMVDPAQLQHKNKPTPYRGKELFGVVHETYLAGRKIDIAKPAGRLLARLAGSTV